MTTQTLIFIIAGLLTTTSVVATIFSQNNLKAIEADLNVAQKSLDSAHIRVVQMRQLINDDLLPRVGDEIDDLKAFNKRLDELSLASLGEVKRMDSVRQIKKDSIQSLFDDLNN